MHEIPEEAVYFFKTVKGAFWIAPEPGGGRLFVLGCEVGPLGSYVSPFEAAHAVRTHATGNDWWDSRPRSATDPESLRDWEQVPE